MKAADPFHRGDLANVLEAGLAFDDRPVDQFAIWIERPEIRLLPVLLLAEAPQRRRLPDIVRARAALRLEAHRLDAGFRFSGALDRHEHDPADPEIQLLADALGRNFRIGRDLVHLDHERVSELAVLLLERS